MRPPLHQRFVAKAQAAITAAVEVYNKPAFSYREETFAILALHAWELLAKAKLLKDADNDVRVIRVYESRETKTGKKSKKQYLRINAAGNAMTIGFVRSMVRLEESGSMPAEVALNLRALVDIRDNSVHYVTPSAKLAQHRKSQRHLSQILCCWQSDGSGATYPRLSTWCFRSLSS